MKTEPTEALKLLSKTQLNPIHEIPRYTADLIMTVEELRIGVNKTKPIHAKPSYYAIIFEPLKKVALKYGYNLVLHGSLNRDMDLIAIPWVEELGMVDNMINEFCEYVGGEVCLFNCKRNEDGSTAGDRFTQKPHGRITYVIDIFRGGYLNGGGFHDLYIKDPETYIDISVIKSSIEL